MVLKRRIGLKIRIFIFLLLAIMMSCSNTVRAITTSNDKDCLITDTCYYDPNPCPSGQSLVPDSSTPQGSSNKYIALPNIPLTGLEVGTTTYGGGYRGGSFGPSNPIQGGSKPYDDNGMGNDGKPLPGRTAWAELGNGSGIGNALGGLPKGTKIEITYNGKSIVAEKDDVGKGGGPINGKPRAVDLWWETARLLDFQGGSGVTTIHAVDPTTPVTPITGQAANAGTPGAPAGAPLPGAAAPKGKVYVLGDSLTVGMRDAGKLQAELGKIGLNAVKINAVTGKAVNWGVEQTKADRAIIATADVMIVGLGTNDIGNVVGGAVLKPAGVEKVKSEMQALIDAAKAANPNIKIYWTDLYGKGVLRSRFGIYGLDAAFNNGLNPTINDLAAFNKFSILHWSTSPEAKQFVPDNNVHPDGHYPDMVSFLIRELKAGGSGSTNAAPNQAAAPASCCQNAASASDGAISTSSAGTTSVPADKLKTADSRGKVVWDFLRGKGLSPTQAAGVLGNLNRESSGFDPALIERGNGIGFGIVQWSFGRRTALEAEARKRGVPPSDFGFQLDYIWLELTTAYRKNTYEPLLASTTSDQATFIWLNQYERPKERIRNFINRSADARKFLIQYGGTAAGADLTTTPGSPSAASTDCGSPASTTSGTVDVIQKISFSESRTIKPTALVLHWWGGRGGIDSLISTLHSRGLSVQIGTTVDGKVYQLMPQLNSYAPHAKCANSWAIGNEIEGGVQFGPDPGGSGQTVSLDLAHNQVQFQSVVNVTMQLMAKFNIPLDGPLAKDGNSGIGVHSHKEVDVNCKDRNGKTDVDDVYLKRVKEEIAKRLAAGGTSSTSTVVK